VGTYDAEEEGGLVGLQRGLRVQGVESMGAVNEGRNYGGAAELFDELQGVSRWQRLAEEGGRERVDLLEGLVVDEAGGVFWDFQLAFLDVLAEFPGEAGRVSRVVFGSEAGRRGSLSHDSTRAKLKDVHMRDETYMVVAGGDNLHLGGVYSKP
jgi:hypothetical protein